MDTVASRISEIIEKYGLTKTAFAAKIGLSQPFVSQICAGTKEPSDRTIADICRKFKVSEEWLRNGTGEMQDALSDDEQLVDFMNGLMSESSDNFRRRFISVVSALEPEDWAFLEKIADKLAKKKTGP
ncbi:MAG: helix-turn-helix domain-containing protein [Oscillospiraceae bacterium]|nr:helix-turn-helix domain-containing protein [Oscillospiraceae bacterium]